MADLETKIAVHENNNFRLASVNKQFEEMAILILKQEGLIDLDWSLFKVFEDFPDYERNIQINHLINHPSGL